MIKGFLLTIVSALVIGCSSFQNGVTTGAVSPLPSFDQPAPPWESAAKWEQLTPELRIRGREIELQGRVQSYLATRGYRLGPGAQLDFDKAITRGAREIQDHPVSRQREETEKAIRHLQTVVDAMIAESKRIPGYEVRSYRAIGEETLMAALRKLCPLWPICDGPR
ncbi:MAG: hypothetical protein HT579_03970 [Candidatus Accumulibacter similis]|nr:MAG: hypothetical protein HT579_03970 [Candidatus Accumulibacter similis]